MSQTPPSGAPERRPPFVPPHIAWPAFIVFLLTISVTMAAVTYVAARSDGGARVVVPPSAVEAGE